MSSSVKVGRIDGLEGMAGARAGMTGQPTGVRKSQVGGKTADISLQVFGRPGISAPGNFSEVDAQRLHAYGLSIY
jgi:hypothetical protein